MPAKAMYAALDIGTSSMKCLAFVPGAGSAGGAAMEVVGRELMTVLRPGSGLAEIDPAQVRDAAFKLIRRLADFAASRGCHVRRLALTGHITSIICVDREGREMQPCPIWQDQRCHVEAAEFADEFLPRMQSLLGIVLPRGANWPAPKLRWFARHRRDMLASAWRIFQIKDYLWFHLTKLAYSDPASQIGLCHLREHRYAREVLDWCPIGSHQLPELHSPTTVAAMDSTAAGMLFPHGNAPQVVLGTADMAAAFRGHALVPGEGILMGNTAELLGVAAAADATAVAPRGVVRYPVSDDIDLIYGVTSNGGASAQWLRELLEIDDLASLDDAASALPPGCDGLTFLPYVTGERAPLWNPNLSGMFAGLKAGHTRAHLYRAVVEGCAFSKRHVLDTIVGDGTPRRPGGPGVPGVMRVSGGSAGQPLWGRIRASVLNLPLKLLPQPEASALGAIALAAHADDPGLVQRCQLAGDCVTIEPAGEWIAAYDRAYARYRELAHWYGEHHGPGGT